MKKILIATTALAAFTASSAFALDVKTTGSVEYKYTKNKEAQKSLNPKLSHGTTEVKFAAEGASNGLAYGAWVKVKNGGAASHGAGTSAGTSSEAASTATASTAGGWTQGGAYTQTMSTAGNNTHYLTQWKDATGATASAPANNATTQSAMWVSGSFGKVIIGQAGDAGLAPSGVVKAASFTQGTKVAGASAGTVSGERITWEAPAMVDGLAFSYTTTLKGNAGNKENKATAPSQWGISYKTSMSGVSVKVGHTAGKTAGKKNTAVKLEEPIGQNPTAGESVAAATTKKNGAVTNTETGIEVGYGNFTVGYGTFTNGKKFNQTKSTGGSNYGVKYASGDWSVGYTVQKSEDKNMYNGTYNKSASTSAYSASYTVASGFSVYASKSSNSVKNSANKTTKNNYTIIGGKISF